MTTTKPDHRYLVALMIVICVGSGGAATVVLQLQAHRARLDRPT
jgi:hypothetical protein